MRTKTLLLAAALTAAGIASIHAQSNVYSVNVVGYVNVVCSNGFTLVNTPLARTDGNYSITNLLDAYVPAGNSVYTFSGGGFQTYVKDEFDSTWTGGGVAQLPNGAGYFIRNTAPTPFTVTFVGEVPQGVVSNFIGSGYTLIGSKVPQAGFIQDLGVSSGGGDQVLRFANGNFVTYSKDEFDLTWSGPGADSAKGPNVGVAEGFFYRNLSGSATFVRNFTIP
jgi:hypothetical protein